MFYLFVWECVTGMSRLYRSWGSSRLIASSGVKYRCSPYLHNLCCGRSYISGDSTVWHCSHVLITNAHYRKKFRVSFVVHVIT